LTSPPDQAQLNPLGERRKKISTTFETQPKLKQTNHFDDLGNYYEQMGKVC
jgi:alpha-mannosidase